MGSTKNTFAIDRLLDKLSRCIRGEAESELLNLRADPELQSRIEFLAERCNEGVLTPDERAEYETYVKFGNFIAILQAKARGAKPFPALDEFNASAIGAEPGRISVRVL